jgi:membrane protease YdiL (CAAX protease family)
MTQDGSGHGGGRSTLSPRQALVDVALALVLAVAGALLAPLVGQLLFGRVGAPLLLVLLLQGALILLGLQVLLNWRGQSWRDIGFRPLRGRDAGLALLALLLVFAVNALVSFIASKLTPDLVQAHQQRLGSFAGLLAGDLSIALVGGAMLFTGFYEEVLARGFLLTRCRTLLGGYWGPVLLSSVLFGLGHFYQGWLGVVQTALVGLVFAALVLRWGTLWPAVLAHAALNTLSLVALRTLAPAG